jgi:glutathione S-transferase
MTKPVIIGFPQSTYVWTARAALEYKGVEHDFQPLAPPQNRAPEHLARHPWGKVPVLEHGDVRLYETTAICSYVDTAFDGPALQPNDPVELARMHGFVSITNSYLQPAAVPRYMLQYIFPSGPDKSPNREVIDAAIPDIRKTLEVLDKEMGESKWLVGDQLTLADLFLGPLVLGLGSFPEGAQIKDGLANLGRFEKQLVDESKFMSFAPQRG